MFLFLSTAGAVSTSHAADCASNQSEYSNSSGACTIPPGTTDIARITATNGANIEANGVAVLVPYGVAVTAESGGAVVFGVDPSAGASTLGELYAGSGGITGLFANGAGSQITASGLNISLPASGITVALAQNGGQITLNEGSTIAVESGGGSRALVADGAGSKIGAVGLSLTGQTGGGDIAVYSTAGGDIDLSGSSVSLTTQGGGIVALRADQGSTIAATDTAVTVSGTGGNVVGVNASGASAITLEGGSVNVNGAGGSTALLVQGAGTNVTTSGTNVSVQAANSSAANLQDGGTLSIEGGKVQAEGEGSVGFLVNGASGFTNTLALTGTTVTATDASFSVQGANADIGIDNSTVVQNNGVLLNTQGSATTQFNASHATLSGAITTASDSVANVSLSDGTQWTVTGNSTATTLANDASTIRFAAPEGDATQLASYKTIAVGNYASSGGTLEINTYLGTDGSPSDRLVINGGAASGTTSLVVHNTTGPGASTRANGIEVVTSINGGTTDAQSFELAGEARAGAFDYDLFRGGNSAATTNDWFLRSDFTIMAPPPPGGGGSGGGGGGTTGGGGGGSTGGGSGGSTGGGGGGSAGSGGGSAGGGGGTTGGTEPPVEPPPVVSPEIDIDPPTEPLAPGTYPIIGPELATYGVVQPIARQMGTTMLGTLHERIGDTLLDDPGSGSGWGRSTWGRFFGQQIDDRYRAFADPSASGRLLGLQAGLDLWHGSLVPGQRDTAGVYFAYANSNVDVDGLVTDLGTDSYVNEHTGRVDLDAYAGGLYWTHYGQQGWYLDAVLQGTFYSGDATTSNARLPVSGGGFVSSLEAGYPLPIGQNFVLEPQMQVIWQYVSFSDENDGLGPVALGSSSGTTGRVGVRGRWTFDGRNGQVWQPYGRVNLWHDWGGESGTTFASDPVPLLSQATRLEFAAGLTTRINNAFSAYLQAGYQFAVGGS